MALMASAGSMKQRDIAAKIDRAEDGSSRSAL
jgi:hypothetical protein